MLPISGYQLDADGLAKVKPIDMNPDIYDGFVGNSDEWNKARAFDSALVKYYNGLYPLKTVNKLSEGNPTGYDNWDQLFIMIHYGDWPSPEVFFINE